MDNTFRLLLLTAVASMAITAGGATAQTRDSLRSDFGIELLGKAIVYSFSYQRMVSSNVGLQTGISAWGGSDDFFLAIPIGARAYFSRKSSSPFLTGGTVLVTGDTFDDDLGTVVGYVGLGFEFRGESGLLFRGSLYSLFDEGEFLIWPGLNVGYAF